MTDLLLAIDESGAKGYSDQVERSPGEAGVMAGFVLPAREVNRVRTELERVQKGFLTNGKPHITDLSRAEQERLRTDIFDYFQQTGICWFFEAVYVQGFHENAKSINKMIEDGRKKRRSPIKVSHIRYKESLHSELFLGIFGKAVAFGFEVLRKQKFHIEVLSDQVDKKLLKMFEAEGQKLLSIGKPTRREVTGFDPAENKVVRGEIRTEIKANAEVIGDYSEITFTIGCETSSLTIAADVLSNSVYHHLKKTQENKVGKPLNTKDAITGHPLANLVFGAWESKETNYIADAIFMHPKQRGG